ncbi:hypothetical protein ZWY2020_040563 [Hordeum vulgare]|nr:hypothetical protein ZWY2020_040563 [Hordeum vulgare]
MAGAAPAASTASPPASAVVAIEGKPTVLVAEKLVAAGLALFREFANIDCSYGLSPAERRAKISLCDTLIMHSGTKVGRDVFEANGAGFASSVAQALGSTTSISPPPPNTAVSSSTRPPPRPAPPPRMASRSSDMSQIRQLDFMYLSYFDVHLNCFEV